MGKEQVGGLLPSPLIILNDSNGPKTYLWNQIHLQLHKNTHAHTHINSYTHSFTWTEAYTPTQTCLRAQQVIVVWTVWERRAEKRGCNWRSVSLLCGCFQSISKLLTSPAVPQLIASNDLIATHIRMCTHPRTHTHARTCVRGKCCTHTHSQVAHGKES